MPAQDTKNYLSSSFSGNIFSGLLKNLQESYEQEAGSWYSLLIAKPSHQTIQWYPQYQRMHQNDSARKVRLTRISVVLYECSSLPPGAVASQPCQWGGAQHNASVSRMGW